MNFLHNNIQDKWKLCKCRCKGGKEVVTAGLSNGLGGNIPAVWSHFAPQQNIHFLAIELRGLIDFRCHSCDSHCHIQEKLNQHNSTLFSTCWPGAILSALNEMDSNSELKVTVWRRQRKSKGGEVDERSSKDEDVKGEVHVGLSQPYLGCGWFLKK